MGKVIAVLGGKGGSGKTWYCHALAHGFGLLNIKSIYVITDLKREKPDEKGRAYMVEDGRDPTGVALQQIVERIRNLDNSWVCIIDGGGNREAVDQVIYKYADLTYVPFQHSTDDYTCAKRDSARMPKAILVPLAWPTIKGPRARAEISRQENLGYMSERMIDPVPATQNADLLSLNTLVRNDGSIIQYPTAINNACRKAARQAMTYLHLKQPFRSNFYPGT